MWNQNLGVYKYGPVPLFQQCANHGIFQTWLILAPVSSFPRLAIGLLQVVATALSAAQHRRDRLVAMRGATTPTTPDLVGGLPLGWKERTSRRITHPLLAPLLHLPNHLRKSPRMQTDQNRVWTSTQIIVYVSGWWYGCWWRWGFL